LFIEICFLKINLEFIYLKILSAISIIDISFIEQHQENLIKLLNNSNFQLHFISVKLLAKLGVDYKSLFIPKTQELPFSYNMEYDYKPELLISENEKMDRINKTGYLRDTNDPIEYCILYLAEINLISEETGISVVNLANRIMMLGDKIGVKLLGFQIYQKMKLGIFMNINLN